MWRDRTYSVVAFAEDLNRLHVLLLYVALAIYSLGLEKNYISKTIFFGSYM